MGINNLLIAGDRDREACEQICRNAMHLFSAGHISSEELDQIVDGQNVIYKTLKEDKKVEQKIILINQPAPQKSEWELAKEKMEGLLKNAVISRVPNQIDHVVIRPRVVPDARMSGEGLAAFCLQFQLIDIKKQTAQQLLSAPVVLSQSMITGDRSVVIEFWTEVTRVIENTIDAMSVQMILGIKKGEL